MMAGRMIPEEYEAELYKVPAPRFFLFRILQGEKGELELKRCGGKECLQIRFFGVKVPDGSAVSVVIDGKVACQVEVTRRRGRLELSSTKGEAIPAVENGSVVEIQHDGQPLLRGTFKPD